MKTLILYSNDNGEARAALVDHAEDFDTADRETITAKIEPNLPDYNSGGGLFCLGFDYVDRMPPTPTDEWGDEVFVTRLTLE